MEKIPVIRPSNRFCRDDPHRSRLLKIRQRARRNPRSMAMVSGKWPIYGDSGLACSLLGRVGIVTSARSACSTIIVTLALLGVVVSPAFAGLAHQACTSKHHDCGKPRITACCCGDEQGSTTSTTPVPSRVELRADLSPMPAVTSAVHVTTSPLAGMTVYTSPPHRCLDDLPTLFSSLLL